jgi:hypothetical protein
MGAMHSFTPVIVGSMYGRTSVVSFFDVHPSGFMTHAKSGWGEVGFVYGKY